MPSTCPDCKHCQNAQAWYECAEPFWYCDCYADSDATAPADDCPELTETEA